MKIEIQLNKKSIQNAIKLLNQQKKNLTDKAIPEFMEQSADWIINRANEILDRSNIGEDVKSYIFKAWNTEWSGKNKLKIINHSRKACYVEFGVGIIGETAPHPNSNETNWQYNLETEDKDSQGGWIFSVRNIYEIDIPQNAIIEQNNMGKEIVIYTQGTQGVWFLFNALEDFKLNKAQSLWEKIKKKYWG